MVIIPIVDSCFAMNISEEKKRRQILSIKSLMLAISILHWFFTIHVRNFGKLFYYRIIFSMIVFVNRCVLLNKPMISVGICLTATTRYFIHPSLLFVFDWWLYDFGVVNWPHNLNGGLTVVVIADIVSFRCFAHSLAIIIYIINKRFMGIKGVKLGQLFFYKQWLGNVNTCKCVSVYACIF